MANDGTSILIAVLAGVGIFTLLHMLGIGTVYKAACAGLTLVGAFFVYNMAKGKSLDAAAGDLKRSADKNVRQAKGAVNDAYNEARAKAR
ncbi:g2264 [Coccomyxa viridis]|uniref:G2264 protein n=1 Tax=Coccomyxa viridis TaxID=1274662 RepID=A0ABP1FNP3_9CHLO